MEQKYNRKIFYFKNKFLNFSETKKLSTETFKELQPLVSYKRGSYKKDTCVYLMISSHYSQMFRFMTP